MGGNGGKWGGMGGNGGKWGETGGNGEIWGDMGGYGGEWGEMGGNGGEWGLCLCLCLCLAYCRRRRSARPAGVTTHSAYGPMYSRTACRPGVGPPPVTLLPVWASVWSRLSALFTCSLDFLLVSPSLWRPAQCCTHLAPMSHLFVCWALPFGCLICALRPASHALMPNGTIALAPAFAHMPGPLATAARVLRRMFDLTHTVTCDHSLRCNWFSALWPALPLHRHTLWCPTGRALWPWRLSFHCHPHAFWPASAYPSAPAPVLPVVLSYILTAGLPRYISIMDGWCWSPRTRCASVAISRTMASRVFTT